MSIRQARDDDLGKVEEIWKSAYSTKAASHPYSFLIDKKLPTTVSPGQVAWEVWSPGLVEGFPSDCLVATFNDEVVGFEFFVPDSEMSSLTGMRWTDLGILAVRNDLRGRGIGKRLVRSTVELTRAMGARVLSTGTDLDNISAISCYATNGLRVICSLGIMRWYRSSFEERTAIASDISIERAVTKDVGDVRAIDSSQERTGPIHDDRRIPQSAKDEFERRNLEVLIRDIEGGDASLFLAKVGGKSTGYAVAKVDQGLGNAFGCKYGNLVKFATRTDLKGRGIAKRLIREIIGEWAIPRGISFIDSLVPLNNTGAIRVLEGCGFNLAHCTVMMRGWY